MRPPPEARLPAGPKVSRARLPQHVAGHSGGYGRSGFGGSPPGIGMMNASPVPLLTFNRGLVRDCSGWRSWRGHCVWLPYRTRSPRLPPRARLVLRALTDAHQQKIGALKQVKRGSRHNIE
jgi:hypothetical protein